LASEPGQNVGDVPFLMAVAAMDEGVLTEDVADRPPQRLAGVDREQDRLGGVEAAIDRPAGCGRASRSSVQLPSESPGGIFTPSVVIASATTWVRSATSMPSSIITVTRTSSRRRDISSESEVDHASPTSTSSCSITRRR
jgi:hypothetical protein